MRKNKEKIMIENNTSRLLIHLPNNLKIHQFEQLI